MAEFQGSCHCGAVRVAYSTANPPVMRRCGCGFCRRHGPTYSADPRGRLTFNAETGRLGRYRFGHGTADFLLCTRCGVLMGVVAEIDGIVRGVVNMTNMEPQPAFPDRLPLMELDGESVPERTERRRRNWTGNVTIEER